MRSWFKRISSALLMAALLCCLTVPALAAEKKESEKEALPWCGLTFIITGIGDRPIVYDGTGSEPDLTGYPLIFMDEGRYRTLGMAARQTLTVEHEDESFTGDSRLESVTSALRRHLHCTPGPLEAVLVRVSRGQIDVELGSDLIYYDRDVKESPFQTLRRANPDMPEGEEDVVQVGDVGEKGGVYEIVWSNGKELSRQLVEVLDSEPVDEIVEYGTAKPVKSGAASAPAAKQSVSVSRDSQDDGGTAGGTLALSDGGSLRFTRAISMSATAYTQGYDGVGSRTACGTPARRGVVAVDPRVIPLGTRLYIVANGGIIYGQAVAEDTGVRGNRIDLYFDTYRECINFGRRNCMVYILE